jgi:hypothetical protein
MTGNELLIGLVLILVMALLLLLFAILARFVYLEVRRCRLKRQWREDVNPIREWWGKQ